MADGMHGAAGAVTNNNKIIIGGGGKGAMLVIYLTSGLLSLAHIASQTSTTDEAGTSGSRPLAGACRRGGGH